ncbi:MAG: 50S ribosomal protein L13 [Candidatus Yanofskybacteria bacterium]|nr:50S ribosomal protein L13 [Candidatus Yanofskybacteria bacterium]
MEHKIDATNRIFGRLATEVAGFLRGKNKADFESNITSNEKVIIENIKNMSFSGKKLEQKKYFHYSGYPGGMKTRYLGEEFSKNPAKVFKSAVYRMLPKNKTRSIIIKNLIIK